jgi:RNA polymerase sigma-70 factor, ECF subfamily
MSVSDEELIKASLRGEETATAVLYERYGRLVFTICYRVLNNRVLAEDATQQTFIQAWRAAASFDPTRSFAPWLVTIARRVSIDIQRAETHRSHDSLEARTEAGRLINDTSLVTLPPSLEQLDTVWQVRRAIDALAPDDRELVKLFYLEGLNQTEAAEALGLPVGTVKSRLHRIRHTLALTLASLRDNPAQAATEQAATDQGESAS